MAVIYEDQPDGSVKSYSDQHKKIFGGFPEAEYDVVYDPKDAHRIMKEKRSLLDEIQSRCSDLYSKVENDILNSFVN